ncbi:MAG: Gp15 family bacteriophage protein [Lachnospiraceae bacterium]
MIGALPKSLEVGGREYAIRTDFRVVLIIFQALNDTELSEEEKAAVILYSLYEEPPDKLQEALDKAVWFMDGGQTFRGSEKPVMDWEQDEQMIFSAVNKVAGYETRTTEYLHWWTFLGFFNEIEEGLFSTVVNIRKKRNKGRKLDKTEEEFYKRNREIVNLKKRLSKKEQDELDSVKKLIGG